jgi:hypothetical protein
VAAQIEGDDAMIAREIGQDPVSTQERSRSALKPWMRSTAAPLP